jgi:hypothetical protein
MSNLPSRVHFTSSGVHSAHSTASASSATREHRRQHFLGVLFLEELRAGTTMFACAMSARARSAAFGIGRRSRPRHAWTHVVPARRAAALFRALERIGQMRIERHDARRATGYAPRCQRP